MIIDNVRYKQCGMYYTLNIKHSYFKLAIDVLIQLQLYNIFRK